jgi:hypothetical protein
VEVFMRVNARFVSAFLCSAVSAIGGRALAAEPPPPAAEAARTYTLFVPTTASIHGNAGTFFHTDLWALNRSFASSISVTATYYCFAGPCASASATFPLSPRESKLISDVGATLFGLPETAGAVALSYQSATEDLAVTTRTYTPSLPSPTAGTSVPAFSAADARARSVFLGLGNYSGGFSSGFRSNAGAFNPSFYAQRATFTLYSSSGAVLGTTTADVAARSAVQINDIFSAAGAGAAFTTNAVLVVTSDTPVLAFVTVIDNQSGDSIFATAMDDVPAGSTASLVTNGSFDSFVAPWAAPPETAISWSPADASGSPSSGSMNVKNTAAVASQGAHEAWQCVPVLPGTFLNVSGKSRIPSGQANTAGVYVGVMFSSSPGCTSLDLGPAIYSVSSTATDAWVALSATGVAPARAASARIVANVTKAEAGGSVSALFDDISVSSSSR